MRGCPMLMLWVKVGELEGGKGKCSGERKRRKVLACIYIDYFLGTCRPLPAPQGITTRQQPAVSRSNW